MRFLNKAKIDDTQLRECLGYLEKSCQVAAFQAKEIDSYNEVLVKHGTLLPGDPRLATEIPRAADRLAHAAKEVLERQEDIDKIPMPASSMHHAWWAAYRAYSAWASAENEVFTAEEHGKVIETASIDKLMKEYQKAWIKAEREEKRFLKHLKLNTDSVSRILSHAENAVSAERWEPASIPRGSLSTESSLSFSEMDHVEMQTNDELSVIKPTKLTASVKKRYKTEDVKWLTEFLRLYDQSNINDITKLDSDNMPADYIAILDGAMILPPILKAVEDLPRPQNKELHSLKKAFKSTLWTAIIASDDVREMAECQSDRIPAASIAFDIACAANMNEQLVQKLAKVLRE